MSGTSMDALDATLVDFSSDRPRLLGSLSQPFPAALKQQLLALTQPGDNELARMGEADIAFAHLSAELVKQLLQQTGTPAAAIAAIGSHGQTIRHSPDTSPAFTIQIGDPNTLVELTGITTVADLRRRDMAAGGQGAPLVPAFHAALYHTTGQERVILNLGGIANITRLPADPHIPVSGFDTGPANILIDSWITARQGREMDRDGDWGRSGKIIPALLANMLSDPYFAAAPPKSTGREYFHLSWLQSHLDGQNYPAEDVQASLYALSVESIAQAIARHAPACQQLLVCGGGAYNALLMEMLTKRLEEIPVLSTRDGDPAIEPRWMEAMAFAWLARQTLSGKSGNLPAVTGARHPVILGGIYPGINPHVR